MEKTVSTELQKNCFHIQHTFGKIYESKAITDILLDRR